MELTNCIKKSTIKIETKNLHVKEILYFRCMSFIFRQGRFQLKSAAQCANDPSLRYKFHRVHQHKKPRFHD